MSENDTSRETAQKREAGGGAIIPAPEPTAAMYPSGGVPAPAGPALPHERCPHCGAVTFIERASSLRFVCGICGKARVPVDDPTIKRSEAGVEALARATAARNAALSWTVAGTVLGGFSVLSFIVLVTVLTFIAPGLIATLAAIAASATPMAFAVAGFLRATRKRAEIAPALEEGWAEVGGEVVRALHEQGRDVSIESISKLMRTNTDQAEHLLAQLSAKGLVRSRIDDSGLHFELAHAGPARVAAELGAASSSERDAEYDREEAATQEAAREANAEQKLAARYGEPR